MGLVQTKIDISIETSPQLIESLHMAREVALKSDVAQVLPAHLVLAMLEDDESSFLLDAYGVDFKKIRLQVGKLVQKQAKPKSLDQHAVFSASIEAIMQHAREQAQKNALAEVDSNLILAVLLSEKEGFLAKLLSPYDLDTSGVLQYLELREGKTVNIDPLPSQQSPAVKSAPSSAKPSPARAPHRTPAPAPSPISRPELAPKSLGPKPATPAPVAPPNSGVMPPAKMLTPSPGNQPASPPAPMRPAPPQMPQGHPAAHSLDYPAQNAQVPAAPTRAPGPALTMPPAGVGKAMPAPNTPMETKLPDQQGLADLSGKLQALSSTNTPAPVPTSASASPAEPAPSRLRSFFSGRSKKEKDKPEGSETAKQHDAAKVARQPAPVNLAPPPIQQPQTNPAPGLAPKAANNNQSVAVAETPPAPEPISQQASIPAASVEQLVDPMRTMQSEMADHLARPANINQQNRPAKRRRTAPASLGSNESLSATGSVLEKGRLIESIPRKMKVNKPNRAEVRITREQLDEINSEFEDLSANHIHELAVTEAMTVQLRAPGSGFHIENLSPQTQWIDRNQRHINDADFGVWRWNVTPIKAGKSRLQLVISARTVDDDGNIHIADIPDKIIELAIARDHGKTLKKAAFITLLVIASLALGRYGEIAWQWVSMLINKFL